MASHKVPKLVIRRPTSRKLLLPEDMPEQEQLLHKSGRISTQASFSKRTTIAMKQAKKSVRKYAYLLAIGICAAIVMYGVVASITASGEARAGGMPGIEGDAGEGNGAAKEALSPTAAPKDIGRLQVGEDGLTVLWHCIDEANQIYRKTTTSGERTNIDLFRKVKKGSVTIWEPVQPEKPKAVKPTDEKDKERRQQTMETVPQ